MKQASTKDSALNAGLTSDTVTVSAKKPRKKKPNGREKECSQCQELITLCQRLQDELRDSWREYRRLRDKLIANGIELEDENGNGQDS